MLQTLNGPAVDEQEMWSAEIDNVGLELEDSSPFGLQGLTRQPIHILKADCVTRLAVALSLRGTRKQIRDPDFVNHILAIHKDWLEEYHVVHLIEKSLWISGHSDLVMTLLRNPSQIPDNPPPEIMKALAHSYAVHPDANIWYGVPLFGEEKNEDGLPIPVTAAEVREEASKRIKAAQDHALRFGWIYRTAMRATMVPAVCWRGVTSVARRISRFGGACVNHIKRARRDARRRARAAIEAEFERLRFGCSQTRIPEHQTTLGRVVEFYMSAFYFGEELVARSAPIVGVAAVPLFVAKLGPALLIPLTVVSCDPFLFVELPNEPGKLRHLGHWYWQEKRGGKKKLHVHV